MKKLSKKSGQSAIEYVLIMSVVLVAILAVGFIDHMRGAFGEYFTRASSEITTNHYKVSLGNVKRIGAFKNYNKAYGDKGIDHAEGKTGYH